MTSRGKTGKEIEDNPLADIRKDKLAHTHTV